MLPLHTYWLDSMGRLTSHLLTSYGSKHGSLSGLSAALLLGDHFLLFLHATQTKALHELSTSDLQRLPGPGKTWTN